MPQGVSLIGLCLPGGWCARNRIRAQSHCRCHAGMHVHKYAVADSPEKCLEHKNFSKAVFIDAHKITHELVGEVPPNMAMLGALAKVTGCISVESLIKAIQLKIQGKAGEVNARACETAYENA